MADDRNGHLFVGEEDRAIYRYGAEPETARRLPIVSRWTGTQHSAETLSPTWKGWRSFRRLQEPAISWHQAKAIASS